MSSENTLAAYSDVVAVNAQHIVLALSSDFKARNEYERRKAFAGSNRAGYFYLFRSQAFPEQVFECVISRGDPGESMSSLYMNHRIFSTPGTLLEAREALIRAISEKVGLSPEAIGIDDGARGRSVPLHDLATGQLIDLLAERMGKSIVVANSHSALPV